MGKIRCKTSFIGKQNIWLDRTDSTNEVIKRLLRDGQTIEGELGRLNRMIEGSTHNGLTVVADHQTKGKGRSGREWVDEIGSNIAMSVLLQPGFGSESISMLTLVSAMAVASMIREKTKLKPFIKWPNDVLVGNRKVCGILTELVVAQGQYCVIVGIGVNVNQAYIPDELTDKATSLLIESEGCIPYDRAELVDSILENLERYYNIFGNKGDMTDLMDEYNSQLVNIDKQVKVMDPSEDIEGIARGIDDKGKLIVQTPDGELHHIYAGEVSVRGLYGYV